MFIDSVTVVSPADVIFTFIFSVPVVGFGITSTVNESLSWDAIGSEPSRGIVS